MDQLCLGKPDLHYRQDAYYVPVRSPRPKADSLFCRLSPVFHKIEMKFYSVYFATVFILPRTARILS